VSHREEHTFRFVTVDIKVAAAAELRSSGHGWPVDAVASPPG